MWWETWVCLTHSVDKTGQFKKEVPSSLKQENRIEPIEAVCVLSCLVPGYKDIASR